MLNFILRDYLNTTIFSTKESFLSKVIDKFPDYFKFSPQQKDVFLSLTESLNNVFDDNWCYTFTAGFRLPVIHIKIEDFEIQNSIGEKHPIKDLFIRLIIDGIGDNYIFFNPQIYGFRTTLTNKENQSGYMHSHINTASECLDVLARNSENFFCVRTFGYSFCLGGSEVRDLMSVINSNPYNKDILELFLYTLKDVFKWESLEGVPYKRISGIGFNSSGSKFRKPVIDGVKIAEFVEYFITKHKDSLSYRKTDSIKVVENDFFRETLKKEAFLKDFKDFFCTRSELSCNDFLLNISETLPVVGSKKYEEHIIFRGSPVYFKLEGDGDSPKKRIEDFLKKSELYPGGYEFFVQTINLYLTMKFLENSEKVYKPKTSI